MLEDKLKEAVAQLHAAGAGASYHVINVTKEEDWARAVAGVVAAHGKVDVLVQAAGITGRTGIKTHEVDPANWDAVMGVNARGIFLGCRAVLPSMVSAGYGRIVNIASIAGKEGNAGMAAYSASKGAVIALTKCIGKEYAELGEGTGTGRERVAGCAWACGGVVTGQASRGARTPARGHAVGSSRVPVGSTP